MRAAVDEQKRQAVFVIAGAEITDPQWEMYSATFERLSTHKGGPAGCVVAISEKGSAMPNAKWRKRFADLAAIVRKDSIFVMVARSPLARGVVTAVNWLKPFEFRYAVVATWEEGVREVERFDPSPTLRAELEALRERATPVPR